MSTVVRPVLEARPVARSRLDYRVDRDVDGRPVVILLSPVATGQPLSPERVRNLAGLLLQAAAIAEAHA